MENPSTDLPALARDQLVRIRAAIEVALEQTEDPTTRAHLEDLAARIGQLLEGRFPASDAAAPAATAFAR